MHYDTPLHARAADRWPIYLPPDAYRGCNVTSGRAVSSLELAKILDVRRNPIRASPVSCVDHLLHHHQLFPL
jgi:hypothetical protein